jgi:uncharacterized iron-regulated membrane protein
LQITSYMVALIGALVLLAAVAAWWKIFRQPRRAPSPRRLAQDNRSANAAAIAMAVAFGLCALAAILAIIDWISV